MTPSEVNAQFQAEFDMALQQDIDNSGMPIEEWFKGGVTKPETMVEQWRELGPKVIQNYIDWYESSDYKVWITPDGIPAVELELDVMFGRVPVKMYIDSILVNRFGLLVQDLKSGSSIPDSLQQVGLYASGVELKYGIRPLYGAYFMARGVGKNKDIFLTEPRPLSAWEYSIDFWTQQLEAAERVIEAGQEDDLYVAKVGKHCERCDVARACAAVGGDLAKYYDTTSPNFVPF